MNKFIAISSLIIIFSLAPKVHALEVELNTPLITITVNEEPKTEESNLPHPTPSPDLPTPTPTALPTTEPIPSPSSPIKVITTDSTPSPSPDLSETSSNSETPNTSGQGSTLSEIISSPSPHKQTPNSAAELNSKKILGVTHMKSPAPIAKVSTNQSVSQKVPNINFPTRTEADSFYAGQNLSNKLTALLLTLSFITISAGLFVLRSNFYLFFTPSVVKTQEIGSYN